MRKFHFPVNLKAAADAAHHLVASAGMAGLRSGDLSQKLIDFLSKTHRVVLTQAVVGMGQASQLGLGQVASHALKHAGRKDDRLLAPKDQSRPGKPDKGQDVTHQLGLGLANTLR